MKREVYRKVVKEIEKEDWDFDQVLQILREKFPYENSSSLRSILHQEYQKRVKRKHKEFNSEEGRKKIVQDFKKAVNSKDYSRKIAKIHNKPKIQCTVWKNEKFTFTKNVSQNHFQIGGSEFTTLRTEM